MRGVFLDDRTVTSGDLDFSLLRSTLGEWHFAGMTPDDRVSESIRDADVVISNKVVLDRNTLAAAKQLKLVCVAATGTNIIDLQAATEHGITVCNVRGYATASVVEHVFMVILALQHRLLAQDAAVRRGDWGRSQTFSLLDHGFSELHGKNIGIIGYGELGSHVARVARAFGMNILVAQRPGGTAQPGRCPLPQLYAEADVISLHCPLDDNTRNLIGTAELKQMRNSALLINTARGGIVNEGALARALRNGDIAGAAIDVLSEEPPRHHNPLLEPGIPNLIITPHVAWAGVQSRQALLDGLAANIKAYLSGSPRNVVTP